MIYIDPPYNTGNDFIYSDDFSEPLETYLRRVSLVDESGVLQSNPKASGRFHSNWLSLMYPRLLLAKQLLAENGLIVISIDDNEDHHLRAVANEIFGEENFVAKFVWKSRQFPDARAKTKVSTDHEYLIAYSNSIQASFKGIGRDEAKFQNPDNDPRGLWMSRSILGLATAEQRPNLHYAIVNPATGASFRPPPNTGWRYSRERMSSLIEEGKILFPADPTGRPREKKFRSELQDEFISFPTVIDDVFTAQGTAEIRQLFGYQAFDFPKPTKLLSQFLGQIVGADEIVLDFFAGAGATAHALWQQSLVDSIQRRFIVIQIPEPLSTGSEAYRDGFRTIVDVAKERLRRSLLSFRQQQPSQLPLDWDTTNHDLGFRVYRLDRSHFKPWTDYAGDDVAALQAQFDAFESPLVDGWKPDDLLVEIMLTEGFPLDGTVARQAQFAANDVRLVESDFHEHRLWVCLDQRIEPATASALTMANNDVFICLDSAVDDEMKLRLSDGGNLKTI